MPTATLTPTGGDDTTQFVNAMASFPSSGGLLQLNGFQFNVSFIKEATPGLVVRSVAGHRVQGPGGITTGTIIKSSSTVDYTWTRTAPLNGSNEFRGALIEGVTFTGPGPGGLLLQSCYNTIRDCLALNYTVANARGFYALAPTWPGGAAQENTFDSCGAQDCYIGLESACADQSEIANFLTLKTTAGGIHGQGYGLVIRDSSRIIGGKLEGNSTGALLASKFAQMLGVGFEDNANWDVDSDRGATEQSLTQNIIFGGAGKVRIGPWNFADMVIGGGYPRLLSDVANPQGIAKNTFALGAWNS